MITVEVFPASYGDALLVSYGDPASPTRLLIDGGLTGAAQRIQRRLAELDATIDLFVVTHIDADHIAGAVRLLDTPSFVERLQAVWFNGRVQADQFSKMLGALDGERLGNRIKELGLPWNAGWDWRIPPGRGWTRVGGPVVIDGAPIEMPMPGGARAIVLSPDPEKMKRLLKEWRRTINRAGLGKSGHITRDAAEQPPRQLMGRASLADVAKRDSTDDDTEANGSSIAFVLEIPDGGETRRLLMTGDAHPDLLLAGIDQLRGADERYAVDLCKLPHHGSRRNVTFDLVKALDCSKWIVSTNGKRFFHPNNEAIARVLVSNPGSTIYCNYGENQPLSSFTKSYPMSKNGYTVERPPPGRPGITVTVGP